MSKIVVAILCGGRSSEHEISCISAGGILSALDRTRYEPILIGITRTSGRWVLMPENSELSIVNGVLPSVPETGDLVNTDIAGFSVNGKPLRIDLIFPALHGTFGEDGTIQGFCEIANIPYVGSGVLIEEAVIGREIECAVLEVDGALVTSPPGEIQIDKKYEFYDFDAKYLDGATTAIIPAQIPEAASKEIERQAAQAFRALGCSGLARVDFFYCEDGQIVINELNTMPGFTPTSMYPRLLASRGITYTQIIDELMKSALTRKF